jgi:hypothetical protein
LANERTGLNDKVANVIATTVGSMWMFYASPRGRRYHPASQQPHNPPRWPSRG